MKKRFLNDPWVMHKINSMTAYDLLHPNLRDHINELNSMFIDIAQHGDFFSTHRSKVPGWLKERRSDFLESIGAKKYGGVHTLYRIPLISPELCNIYLSALEDVHFEPNPDEKYEAQIDEYVVDPLSPLVKEQLSYMYRTVVVPLWRIIYGITPYETRTNQFSKYSFKGELSDRVHWHTDNASIATTVVELDKRDPGDEEEFEFFPGDKINISPEQGYATLFNGHMCAHRFNGIKKNDRHILVWWSNDFKTQPK